MDLSIYITAMGMERIQKRIVHLMNERPEVIQAVAVAENLETFPRMQSIRQPVKGRERLTQK